MIIIKDLSSQFKLTLLRLLLRSDSVFVGLFVCVRKTVVRVCVPCVSRGFRVYWCKCVCVYKRTYIRVNTLVMKFHRTSMSDINDS